MQHTQWVVDEVTAKAPNKNKMAFVTPIKITDNMDENQKTFFANYNNMQKELIKNGLMESK